MSSANGNTMAHQTALKGLKRWRIIQLASILPMVLCMAWMFYSREATEFGIVAFFLILVIGVMLPEAKADIAATNVMFREELMAHREEMQQLLKEELHKSLKEFATQQQLQ